ncbi:AsmA family protein [Azospirillaceae bacterium]
MLKSKAASLSDGVFTRMLKTYLVNFCAFKQHIFKQRALDRWARALETGVTILVLAVGACGGLLWVLNTDMVIRRLPALLEYASGYQVQFGGVRFTLSPGLTMQAQGVHVVNPTWQGRPEIMRADRMEVDLNFRALFLGLPMVDRLLLEGADFRLATDDHYRPNWSFPPAPNAGALESYPAPAVGDLILKHAHIDYRDGVLQRDVRLDLASVTGSLSEHLPLALILDGRLFDVPFTATIGGGLIKDFFYDHAHWPLQISMQTSGVGVEARGALDRPLSSRRFDFGMAAAGAKLSALNGIHGLPLPATGPFRFTARVSGVPDNVSFADSRLTFGRSDLGGDMTLRLIEGRRPQVKGRLTGDVVHLSDLLNDGSSGVDQTANLITNGRVISTRPLRFDAFDAIDATLSIALQRFDVGASTPPSVSETPVTISFSRVDAETKLVDRKLTIEPFRAIAFGGWLGGRLMIDAADVSPRITLNGRADHIDLTQALPVLAGGALAPTGKLDVLVDVTGRGANPHALLSGTSGRFMLSMDGGVLPIRHFDLIAADLVTALLPWIKRDELTPYNCMIARFGVSEGLAYSRDILLDTEKITILGGGSVDMSTERINFLFNPSPKDASLISLATPVRLSGGFSGVSAAPDALGLARGAAVGAAGLAMGAMNPLGALLPFISIGTGENAPCLAALHRPFATPNIESDRPLDQIFNFIGSTTKPLLGILPGYP